MMVTVDWVHIMAWSGCIIGDPSEAVSLASNVYSTCLSQGQRSSVIHAPMSRWITLTKYSTSSSLGSLTSSVMIRLAGSCIRRPAHRVMATCVPTSTDMSPSLCLPVCIFLRLVLFILFLIYLLSSIFHYYIRPIIIIIIYFLVFSVIFYFLTMVNPSPPQGSGPLSGKR